MIVGEAVAHAEFVETAVAVATDESDGEAVEHPDALKDDRYKLVELDDIVAVAHALTVAAAELDDDVVSVVVDDPLTVALVKGDSEAVTVAVLQSVLEDEIDAVDEDVDDAHDELEAVLVGDAVEHADLVGVPVFVTIAESDAEAVSHPDALKDARCEEEEIDETVVVAQGLEDEDVDALASADAVEGADALDVADAVSDAVPLIVALLSGEREALTLEELD